MLTDITRQESMLVFCLHMREKLRQKGHLNPTERTWEMREINLVATWSKSSESLSLWQEQMPSPKELTHFCDARPQRT